MIYLVFALGVVIGAILGFCLCALLSIAGVVWARR